MRYSILCCKHTFAKWHVLVVDQNTNRAAKGEEQWDDLLAQELLYSLDHDQQVVRSSHSIKTEGVARKQGRTSSSESVRTRADEDSKSSSTRQGRYGLEAKSMAQILTPSIPCRSDYVDSEWLLDAGDALYKVTKFPAYGSSAPCKYTTWADLGGPEPTSTESKSVCEAALAGQTMDGDGEDSDWTLAPQDGSITPRPRWRLSDASSEDSVFIYPLSDKYQQCDRLYSEETLQERRDCTAQDQRLLDFIADTRTYTPEPGFTNDSAWKKPTAEASFEKQAFPDDTNGYINNNRATGYPSDVHLTATMWVGCVNSSVTFKELQRFFYDVDILASRFKIDTLHDDLNFVAHPIPAARSICVRHLQKLRIHAQRPVPLS